MKEINVKLIKDKVAGLCIDANVRIRRDVLRALNRALRNEKKAGARNILRRIIRNSEIAKLENLPMCQDTGMAMVYLRLGQDAHIQGGSLAQAVNQGIREGYKRGNLRKSVVAGPFIRKNTFDNTPGVLHTEIVRGDKVRITVVPKGFGCENKGRVKMFDPTAEFEEIEEFILTAVKEAGGDACPPFVLGIGIGGTMEKAAALSKEAVLCPVNGRSRLRHIADLERRLLRDVNRLGIGPMGLGGDTTALGVRILIYPTHIAGLPVAVNISCHSTRSACGVI